MKKTGIRIILALVLTLVMLVGAVGGVEAAKPIKGYVEITNLVEGSITFDYGWDKVSAHYYQIVISRAAYSGNPTASPTGTVYNSGIISLGGRTPQGGDTGVTITNAQATLYDIEPGFMYYVQLYLYGKNNNHGPMKNVRPYDYQVLPLP